MRCKTKLLIKNNLPKRILCIYITVLMLIFFSFNVCTADPLPPLGQPFDTELTADAGGPYTGNVSEYILFDGSGSTGDIASYEWSFDDGTTGIGIIIYHMYSTSGTYVVTLTVTNSTGGTASDTTTVTVTEPPIVEPTIKISNLTYPTRVTSDDIVTIYAAVIGDDPIFSVTLSWYDGLETYKQEMTESEDIYSIDIGPFSEGTVIDFEIVATDINQESAYHNGRFEVAESDVVEEIDKVSRGEEREVELEGTGISRITFKPTEDLHNVEIIIEQLTTEEIKEKTYSAEDQQVYWYFNLKITANNTYVPEDSIESSTIEFKVDKSWANRVRTDEAGTRYNLSDISLYRYNDGTWEKFTATIVSEEHETYILFKVEVPGYSTFAVVGSKVVEKEETFQEEPEIPWIIIIGVVIAAIVVLMIVLIKARYIYKDEETRKK